MIVSKTHSRFQLPEQGVLLAMPRVDPVMEKAFCLIGYNNINVHHVTNYKEFIRIANKKFDLVNFSRLPVWIPEFAELYFNILFQKNFNKINSRLT